MASGKFRSTRRLRSWIVEQVNSGKYRGLVWDNHEKTMFRIPWKHAGKQDFRTDEDAAIFKAWAEFKGKLVENGNSDPASWKTRLRCALNKSPEFSEVTERSQFDISEPYKVYRLVPLEEQGVVKVKKENGQKPARRSRRRSSESEQDEQQIACKKIKEEVFVPQPINMSAQEIIPHTGREITHHEEVKTNPSKTDTRVHSFHITVLYIGQEVLRREVMGKDVRIAYLPPSPVPPSPLSLNGAGFHRIPLPDPPSDMSSDPSLAPRLKTLNKLLPFTESGVVLTLTGGAIYAKRFCQGDVFWRGPHNTTTGPCKMERACEPTQLFSKDIFKQELDSFRSGGKQPQSEITLCFGEELCDGDNVDDKHIIIKISIPWVGSQIKEVKTLRDSIAISKSLAQGK
ncbi:interferon regulatory factor 8-like [Carassius auratus]|uniref:Interferon regulatory factor 8-like n=1 Tax=Carassius auratus TaxID=7957 RepID=A0A6P6MY12_CARAU|nr:interferon regulatory factor 8-like [Carassius auratus]XP_026101230.1 interferon regulatory factor 8-like [Carassius auratus]XP_026101231.1 interferon regulatory factor 8-like [Carassius auratus]